MQTVDIPSNEGLIVDDEPHNMSIVLYSKPSTMTFSIDLDDYSPSPQKLSQEHDDTQEAKFSYFPPDPPQDDGTPVDTNKANTSEPEVERFRLTAQMVADDSPNKFEKRRKEKLESLDKIANDARLKAQQNRAKIATKEKELLQQQEMKDPSLKVPRRKDI
ncbi:unnamed protein product [Lactuca saligna]|uniref:Uncharacterized protein n=1 Tax=Lactuca saligna TaxID=75948 RepID=A0AA36EPN6_LACSI|nr:unnamed protein product [Lactuca saligna]